jgi:hypothetical protein
MGHRRGPRRLGDLQQQYHHHRRRQGRVHQVADGGVAGQAMSVGAGRSVVGLSWTLAAEALLP